MPLFFFELFFGSGSGSDSDSDSGSDSGSDSSDSDSSDSESSDISSHSEDEMEIDDDYYVAEIPPLLGVNGNAHTFRINMTEYVESYEEFSD